MKYWNFQSWTEVNQFINTDSGLAEYPWEETGKLKDEVLYELQLFLWENTDGKTPLSTIMEKFISRDKSKLFLRPSFFNKVISNLKELERSEGIKDTKIEGVKGKKAKSTSKKTKGGKK